MRDVSMIHPFPPQSPLGGSECCEQPTRLEPVAISCESCQLRQLISPGEERPGRVRYRCRCGHVGQLYISADGTTSLSPVEAHTEDAWYIESERKALGPFTQAEINAQLMAGTLSPETRAWSVGLIEWATISTLDDFGDVPEPLPWADLGPPAFNQPPPDTLSGTLSPPPEAVHPALDTLLICLDCGDFDGARTVARKAVALAPTDPATLIAVGCLHLAQDNAALAALMFERALDAQPDDARAHQLLGQAHWAAGQWPDAIEAWHDALAYDPNLAAAHCDLGLANLRRNNPTEALRYFRAARAAEPNSRPGLIGEARSQCALSNWESTIELFEAAVTLKPDDPCSTRCLSCIYSHTLDRVEKVEMLRRHAATLVPVWEPPAGAPPARPCRIWSEPLTRR